MSHGVLRPEGGDVPVNEPVSVTLNAGEEATIEYTPTRQVTEHVVVTLAASKHKDPTYRIDMDGDTIYGTASIPPTDIDDTVQTFVPPRSFGQSPKVVISNLGSATRTYHTQLIGYEQSDEGVPKRATRIRRER